MLKILFYCESGAYGGHEKMAIAAHTAIRKFSDDMQIHWLVNRGSQQLVQALQAAGLEYSLLTEEKEFLLWRHPLRALRKIRRNAAIIRELSPCLVVVIQGEILLSFAGVIAARLARIPLCSYIPMIHSYSENRPARPFHSLKCAVWRLLFRMNSRYITIDAEQATRLRRENPRAIVEVIENYVPTGAPLYSSREPAKAALGIAPGRKVIGVVGRVVFPHKCQDWVARVLCNDSFLGDKLVLFVGDGPDGPALREMISNATDRFRMIGWRQNLDVVYSAMDVLLIASRVEGVPLVMLEALGYGIPVVGTNRDGMRSWLPEKWRFQWQDVNGMKQAIQFALDCSSPETKSYIAERLLKIHDEARFASEFIQALSRFSQAKSQIHLHDEANSIIQ